MSLIVAEPIVCFVLDEPSSSRLTSLRQSISAFPVLLLLPLHHVPIFTTFILVAARRGIGMQDGKTVLNRKHFRISCERPCCVFSLQVVLRARCSGSSLPTVGAPDDLYGARQPISAMSVSTCLCFALHLLRTFRILTYELRSLHPQRPKAAFFKCRIHRSTDASSV